MSERDLFAAVVRFGPPNICELMEDGSVCVFEWSGMTRAERRVGKELVRLLAPAPDPETGCASFCAWKSPNRPRTPEVSEMLERFVNAVERRVADAP